MEVLSVNFYQDNSHLLVRFNSQVDPATATVVSNYSLDQNQVITEAVMSSEPDTVILTCSPLVENASYALSTQEYPGYGSIGEHRLAGSGDTVRGPVCAAPHGPLAGQPFDAS